MAIKIAPKDFWIKLFVSTGFLGYLPKGSGTLASLVCALLVWIFPHPWFTAALFLSTTIVGAGLSKPAQRAFGNKDPGAFVMDEWAGMSLSLLGLPLTVPVVVSAFVLFRFLDIMKPLVIGKLDRWNNPLSIMADDLAAGLATNLVLRIIALVSLASSG